MNQASILPASKGTRTSGFQLKQFSVQHDQCAMKVNTDSLVLGSWAQVGEARKILDIGTGCGLLALMAVQKSASVAFADAIEIDAAAAGQAADNVASSPWSNRIQVHHVDLQDFTPSCSYDFIISNPPYFARPSPSTRAYRDQPAARETARQQSSLPPDVLFDWVATNINPTGRFCCIYPHERLKEICSVAMRRGLYLAKRLDVKSVEQQPPHVSALEFSPVAASVHREELTVRDMNNSYTSKFRTLCKDFYLHF